MPMELKSIYHIIISNFKSSNKLAETKYNKKRSNGPKVIGLVRRCIRLYREKQHNKEAGYFTNGVTMFYF